MGIASQTSSAASKLNQAPILRAKGIRKSYRLGEEDLVILKNADLTLRRGEFVAIEGRSGSGKSTLLHILGGLDSPTGGTVEFEGIEYQSRPSNLLQTPGLRWLLTIAPRTSTLICAGLILALLVYYEIYTSWAFGRIFFAEISAAIVALSFYLNWKRAPIALLAIWLRVDIFLMRHVTSYDWRTDVVIAVVLILIGLLSLLNTYLVESPVCRLRNTEFGFVFQFYHLLPELNVLENTLVSPLIENSWISYALNKAERAARAMALLEELGLGHRLRHKPNQLSGGERQRVAIARALMNNPKVLFADEPTGNLDYETGRQIMAVLEKLHRDKNQTIVMVTHDRSLASQADRVLVLRDGKLEKPGETSGGRQSGDSRLSLT